MPGLAFDAQCNRLGKGGGYYDAFFHKHITIAKEKSLNVPITVVSVEHISHTFPNSRNL